MKFMFVVIVSDKHINLAIFVFEKEEDALSYATREHARLKEKHNCDEDDMDYSVEHSEYEEFQQTRLFYATYNDDGDYIEVRKVLLNHSVCVR